MGNTVRAWWRYRDHRWGRRDYARHFGYVAGVAFMVACALIATTWTAAQL
jgi:hypothetical protein